MLEVNRGRLDLCNRIEVDIKDDNRQIRNKTKADHREHPFFLFNGEDKKGIGDDREEKIVIPNFFTAQWLVYQGHRVIKQEKINPGCRVSIQPLKDIDQNRQKGSGNQGHGDHDGRRINKGLKERV